MPSLLQTKTCGCAQTFSLAYRALPGSLPVQILIDLPELGHLSGKQAAALAGLAPMSRQSGNWRGKERIQGGRAGVRRAIY